MTREPNPMALFDDPAEQLAGSLAFAFHEGLGVPEGRIEFFEDPDYSHHYAIGADFAYGIRGRDYDAAVVIDCDVWPPRQVAEAEGWWGEEFFRVLWALGRHYNYAWICGEAQLGLLMLRQLLKMGYGRLYYNRDEYRKGRPLKDIMGHWARGKDPVIHKARLAVLERSVIPVSPALFAQMDRFAWVPRSASRQAKAHDELRDADLKPEASVGHDDLVRAFCYAAMMVDEVPAFLVEEEKYGEGTMGQILRHGEVDDPEPEAMLPDPFRRHRGMVARGGPGA